MKSMLKHIAKILKRQRGFTLVEMVTVVAIMGVMAAVAVPMVNSQLGKTREKSYLQDRAMIQTSVDSFFTAADNIRYQGQRQFPILGSTESTRVDFLPRGTALVEFIEEGSGPDLLAALPLNPLRGVGGGEPKWRDAATSSTPGDGNRDSTNEEGLNNIAATKNNITDDGGWYVDDVSFQNKTFAVDSRDYIIDFNLLVDAGLLQNVPESASPDNGGGSTTGSYVWFVKETGQIESIFFHFPDNNVDFGNTTPTNETLDFRGFQEGVYP